MNRGLLVVALGAAFFAGMLVDRVFLRVQTPAPLEALPGSAVQAAACTAPSGATVGPAQTAAASSMGTSTMTGGSSDPSKAESRASGSEKPISIRVEPPRNGAPVLSPEAESKLAGLISDPLPRIADPYRKLNADGSIDLTGKTDEGKTLYRHIDPKGQVTQEGWNDPSGEHFYRSFYSDGSVKLVSWNRADRSLTSINFTQEGLYENRYDKMTDGTSIATNYDDAGQVKSVWRTDKEGKHTKIGP